MGSRKRVITLRKVMLPCSLLPIERWCRPVGQLGYHPWKGNAALLVDLVIVLSKVMFGLHCCHQKGYVVCCKIQLVEQSSGWDMKNWGTVSQQMWHDKKIPLCSKVLSTEHRPKFCSPQPVMTMSPYTWKILERDVKQ
jgi:hypothetical protein